MEVGVFGLAWWLHGKRTWAAGWAWPLHGKPDLNWKL